MPDPTLFSLVVDRLAENPPAVEGADELVLAAFAGERALGDTLAGGEAAARTRQSTPVPGPAGVYLENITVAGFRGIGRPTTLKLPPGPGLILVVGRNGSGKSSLAEALEMLLTGANRRWQTRPKVWTEGWRNLHHAPPSIEGTFAVDGRSAPLTLTRSWANGADVDTSVLSIDGRQRPPDAQAWQRALSSYPPLLSHNDLGRVLEGRPTDLYDALASILGLADIAAAESLLRRERLDAERLIKEQQRVADEIRADLAGLDDERASSAGSALGARAWDLDAVRRAVGGGIAAVEERSELRTLRELSTLPVLDRERVREATTRLREMQEELVRLGGSDAAAARNIAMLLDQALAVHASHQGHDCPVCGTAGVLTYEWRLQTTERISGLRAQAATVDQAHRRAAESRAAAGRLVTPAPVALAEATALGVDTTAAMAQWRRWSTTPEGDDLAQLATHIDTVAPDLIAAVAGVRAAATAELERREDRWRPVAQRLAAWLPDAERAQGRRAGLAKLRAAESWIREAHEGLRRQRFEPIAEQVQRNWEELRQTSSVQLGELRLEGAGTSNHRRLTLDVSIDGEGASALGVMSQGELNCLALSLFLPRASMPESPFRFLVIDDPVQAMDPVKVEGLARVLHRVSRHRQVVVLTHDDRLPAAVRRLDMAATIIEVQRREGSAVELRQVHDPVKRHLDDARAVALSDELPAEARRVVPGFCRLALEAACAGAVSRRMVHEGRTHAEIEAALEEPTTLLMWLALALLKDARRSGDVMALLNRDDPRLADVVKHANRGAHVPVGADLTDLVRGTEKVIVRISGGTGALR